MNLIWEAQLALVALAGLLVGLLIMWLLMRQRGGQKKQHEALVQKFSEYRHGVDQHFVDTAAAVDELNRSYQKVIQHLSSGAQNLMGKEALQEQLAKRSDKSVTVAYLAATDIVPLNAVANDDVPPPPYTDAVKAEVVPLTGQPDCVADRVPAESPAESPADTVVAADAVLAAEDLQRPKS